MFCVKFLIFFFFIMFICIFSLFFLLDYELRAGRLLYFVCYFIFQCIEWVFNMCLLDRLDLGKCFFNLCSLLLGMVCCFFNDQNIILFMELGYLFGFLINFLVIFMVVIKGGLQGSEYWKFKEGLVLEVVFLVVSIIFICLQFVCFQF